MKTFNSKQSISIAKNKIFIDGISRTGKSIFSTILPNFEKMEHIQFFDLVEWLVPATKYGGMKLDYAKSILRIAYNQLYYNLFISRNVNFRKNDQTGIDNFHDPQKYYSRLEKIDDESVIEEIASSEFYVPFMTHDLMVNMDIVSQLDLDCKIIEIYRNPIDVVFSWWKRGLGTRLGKDPREFTLLLEIEKSELPWYCAETDNFRVDRNNVGEVDFIIEIVLSLIEKSVKMQKSIPMNDVLTITYEDILQDTNQTIKNVSSFLKLEPLNCMQKNTKKIGLPKKIDLVSRDKKLKEMKQIINDDSLNRLIKDEKKYNKNIYDLKS